MVKRCAHAFTYHVGLILIFLGFLGCTHHIPRFGIGGRYEEGRDQFFRGRGGDIDKAVQALESVVSQDPSYKDSLTYLGRAYYKKGRYQDAFAILQRALAVNKDDEMAWIAIGLTQLRLGQNEQGIDALKGGITLASRVWVEGYHNYQFWDSRGSVRAALRRSAFVLTKGLEEKESILHATDQLLSAVDEEENFQRNVRLQNTKHLYQ